MKMPVAFVTDIKCFQLKPQCYPSIEKKPSLKRNHSWIDADV